MKRFAPALISILLLVGCASTPKPPVFVQPNYPVLHRPNLNLTPITKEQLLGCNPDAIHVLQERDAVMKNHIGQLEIAIDRYNKFAKEQNQLNSN